MTIIDPTYNEPLENTSIFIDNGKIKEIEKANVLALMKELIL